MVDYNGDGKLVPGVVVDITEHSKECTFDVMFDDGGVERQVASNIKFVFDPTAEGYVEVACCCRQHLEGQGDGKDGGQLLHASCSYETVRQFLQQTFPNHHAQPPPPPPPPPRRRAASVFSASSYTSCIFPYLHVFRSCARRVIFGANTTKYVP